MVSPSRSSAKSVRTGTVLIIDDERFVLNVAKRMLERSGYRPDKNEDLPEIAALLDAAGGADLLDEIDLVVADIFEGVFPGIGQSLKTMLERNTGLRIDIVFQDYGEIRQRLADGELPAWFGWGLSVWPRRPRASLKRS